MDKIQRFIRKRRIDLYRMDLFSLEDAKELIELCRKNKVGILGFEGFHRRTDKSPAAIQIDQVFSRNFSDTDSAKMYDEAISFLDNQKNQNVIYEFDLYDPSINKL